MTLLVLLFHLFVGPNIQVSQDPGVPNNEMLITADLRRAGYLLAVAVANTYVAGDRSTRIYRSSDNGFSWETVRLQELGPPESIDPQIAYGPKGAAFLLDMFATGPPGAASSELPFFRTTDDGRTWQRVTAFRNHSDHPEMTVDLTNGPHRGTVYVAAIGHTPDDPHAPDTIDVFRSQDNGRSFGSKSAAHAIPRSCSDVIDAVAALPDGTVFVAFTEVGVPPGGDPNLLRGEHRLLAVVSRDGGKTFSAPRRVGYQHTVPYRTRNQLDRQGAAFTDVTDPSYAPDVTDGHFKNRIYAVWSDFGSSGWQTKLTHSDDRGKTWSEPRRVGPGPGKQFQGEVAVNNRGVIGVSWLDTRDSQSGQLDREYFSASLDGGASFLPAVPVASVVSDPRAPGNLRLLHQNEDQNGATASVLLGSAFALYGEGGDFAGLTADAAGAFHPLWTDSRTGTAQAWTAPVVVAPSLPAVACSAQEANVTPSIRFVFGRSTYDAATHTTSLPVSLRNVSPHAIRSPLYVRVMSVLNPYNDAGLTRSQMFDVPRIRNAANGLHGAGAIFDYATSLGSFPALLPSTTTEARPWGLQLPPAAEAFPYLSLRVFGYPCR